ncbi:MAG TPA: deoxyribonuclease V [Herpetosiphonaceae bacterium]|nr:deoxyribonuclease V [Herpetosiphonaceae bacterium]
MHDDLHHPWDLAPEEARAVQKRLRNLLQVEDDFDDVRLVAGTDVGFEDGGAITRAAVVVLRFPELTLVEHTISRGPTTFPYVPGLLSFREAPAILEALGRLEARPDLLLCDGAGYAHPRRFGLACHIGLLSGIPAIGVAKSRLIGRHAPVPDERGAWQPLDDRDELIGAVLRTRSGTQPLYISVGNRISLASAVDWTLRCTRGYRLPETTRWAHRLASEKRG